MPATWNPPATCSRPHAHVCALGVPQWESAVVRATSVARTREWSRLSPEDSTYRTYPSGCWRAENLQEEGLRQRRVPDMVQFQFVRSPGESPPGQLETLGRQFVADTVDDQPAPSSDEHGNHQLGQQTAQNECLQIDQLRRPPGPDGCFGRFRRLWLKWFHSHSFMERSPRRSRGLLVSSCL